MTWAGLVALVGAALLAVWAYAGFDTILAVLGRRATRYGLNVTLSVLLLLALLVLVELISTTNNKRLDLSEGKRYTLSDQTIKILKTLKAEVKAVAFYRPPSPNAFEDRRGAEELLRPYADLSSRFRYEFVDPDPDPGRAQRYKVAQYGTVVLEAKVGGGSEAKPAAPKEQSAPAPAPGAAASGTRSAPAKTAATPTPEKAALVEATLQEEQITDLDEEKLTNAIIKVTRGGKRVMYFVVGHGERAINDTGKDGYNAIRTLVEKANYETRDLLLLRETSVPADASVVVIAGPRKDFATQELTTLKEYVRRGGKLLVLLDPDQAASLTPFLLQYGIKVGDDAVIDVDPTSTLFGGSELAPVVSRYSTFHPITRDFKNVATIFPLTRSVDTVEKSPEGVSLEKLAHTSPQSFRGRLNQGQVRVDPRTDKKESVSIAVIATVETKAPDKATGEGKGGDEQKDGEPPKPVKARIVAFGSSSFAANNYVGAFGNRDLFLNTVSWLAEEEDLISIRSREAKSTPIFLLGKNSPTGSWVYAKRGDSSAVLMLPASLKGDLEKSPTDLRDKTIVSLDSAKATRVELKSKDSTIVAAKSGEEWWLEQPIKAKADAFAIGRLVGAVRDLKAKEFVAEATADFSRYGLARPDYRVTVSEKDAPTPKTVLIARKTETTRTDSKTPSPTPEQGQAYVAVEGGKQVFLVDGKVLEDLKKSPLDLRDKRLLAFEIKDVKGVRVAWPDVTIALEKDGDNWKLTQPQAAAADSGKALDLIYSVNGLRFKDIATEKPGDLAKYGLLKPQVEVIVKKMDNTALPAIEFGTVDKEKNQLFAKVKNTPIIYVLEPRVLEDLPRDPVKLKKEDAKEKKS